MTASRADDVDRLFRRMAEVLMARNPDRIGEPFQVADLYQSIVPYRAHRVQLGLDNYQDYEMALLRLLSGERGYASVEPPEAREALAAEVESVNPNTAAYRDFAAAVVRLDPNAVRAALEGESYAPPRFPPPSRQLPQPGAEGGSPATALHHLAAGAAGSEAGRPAGETKAGEASSIPFLFVSDCPRCGEPLPTRRAATFCPHCGEQVTAIECPRCGTDLEPGWKFCITCGHRMSGR